MKIERASAFFVPSQPQHGSSIRLGAHGEFPPEARPNLPSRQAGTESSILCTFSRLHPRPRLETPISPAEFLHKTQAQLQKMDIRTFAH
jgi:hypothetical protein